jgi:beta-lactam-binding protein with PASTA domain
VARPVPADLEDALAADSAARERFWSMPAERKDQWVRWVERTHVPHTRRRRIAETVRRFGGSAAPTAARNGGAAVVPLPRNDWGAGLLGLAVLAGVAALLVWLTVDRQHDDSKAAVVVVAAKATVPKVAGIRYQAAVFQLKEAKLGVKLVRRSSTRPRGIVVSQKPKADANVPQGTPVTLVVSKGPPGVTMPDVVGLAAADAVKALQARKLRPALEHVDSQEAPGTVVSQEPKAGKRAKPGSKVVLQVAKAAVPVAVPDVSGEQQQQAIAALRQAGLTARVVQVPSAQPKGTVVAQRPAGGQKLAKGSAVRLNVSAGAPATATQPPATTQRQTTTTAPATTTAAAGGNGGNNYVGMRLQPAVERIAQGRQKVIVQYVASSKPVGVVVANSIAGSRQRLQVSAGPSPKPATGVPDVTGEDAASAQQDLQSAGFAVIQVQWPVSDQSQNGVVVYETPTGQSPHGSAIVIYVGAVSGG